MDKFFVARLMLAVNLGLSQLGRAQEDVIDDTKNHEHAPMLPGQAVEASRIGKLLDTFYAACGRYPTTEEGLKALVAKPKTLKCKNWGFKTGGRVEPYVLLLPKGWKYVSKNGSSYTIEPLK